MSKHDVYLSDTPQRDQWIATYEGKYLGNFPLFVTALDAVDAAKQHKIAAILNYKAMNFSDEQAEELATQAMETWFSQVK